jgi:hypothetical protein
LISNLTEHSLHRPKKPWPVPYCFYCFRLVLTVLLTVWAASLLVSCASNAKATRRISETDQIKLADMAKHDSDREVRRAAIRKLTDQGLLKQLALQDEDDAIRAAAVWAMTDEGMLVQVAVEAGTEGLRLAAIRRITDPTLLRRLAFDEPNADVRLCTVERIGDPSLIEKIATADRDARVRATATRRITDSVLLAKQATDDSAPEVRIAAASRIVDQALLARMALKDQDQDVRLAALGRLTDQTQLARVATTSSDVKVGVAAVAMLKGQPVLARVALESDDLETRVSAVGKLFDRALLSKVASEATGEYVSNLAYDRLNELSRFPLLEALRGQKSGEQLREAINRPAAKEELAAGLHLAVRKGDVSSSRLLILAGAPVNSRDGFGNTPLVVALASGRIDMARSLLELGADPTLLNRRRMGALHFASFDGETTKFLVRAGARVTDYEVGDETQENVAFAFQWLGKFLEDEAGKSDPALFKSEARVAYQFAANHFEKVSSYYERRTSIENLKAAAVVVGMVLLNAASQAQAQQEANQNARSPVRTVSLNGFGDGQGQGVAFYTVFTPTDALWTSAKTSQDKAASATKLANDCQVKASLSGGLKLN